MPQLKPHLACDADPSKLKLPCLGLRKVDGVRMMHITGIATGRSLKTHGNLYITAKYSDPRCAGFDGEVAFGDTIRSDSLCRDTTSVMSRIQGEPEVEWLLFDWLREDVIHLPYVERHKRLTEYLSENQEWAFAMGISVIPYRVLNSLEEVEAYYEESLEWGFEGSILRSPDGEHKSGRATTKVGAYLRMKPQSDKEALVLRLVEAMENQNEAKVNELGRTERSSHKENKVGKGMVGMLVCKDLETGMEIDVGAGKLTHEERTHYWNNPGEMIGQCVKYRSMDSGIKDKPRFPRYICKRADSDMS
jgi:DNA ligase-1